jgi:ketosteroid isomerase-like protein
MSEESTSPDPGELARRFFEAANKREFDSITSFYARDAVLGSMGMGASFEGVAAIRGFFEDFMSAYEEFEVEPEEILDLGNGVMLSVALQQGRPFGSSGRVQMRFASVATWVDGAIVRQTLYTDIDEARAAAERLAQDRGEAMSQRNVELVRQAYLRVLAGELGPLPDFFDVDAEYHTSPEDPDPAILRGMDEIARGFREWDEAYPDLRSEPVEIKGSGDIVFVWTRISGHGASSGVPVDMEYAQVWTLRAGKAVRVVEYLDRAEALKAVGLEG